MALYDLPGLKQTYLTQFYNTLLAILENSGSGGDIITPRLALITMTKVKVDELMIQAEGTQFSLDGVNNSNVIDLYINAILDESTKHILQIAPLDVIIPADGGTIVPVGNADNSGYIISPTDYLRFVAFKIAGWAQEVNTPITTLDPLYKRQKYPATRGGTAKPVVVKNSITVVQSPVAKIANVALLGVSGKCIISVDGQEGEAVFNSNLDTTASNFVTAYKAAYLSTSGLVLTASTNNLIFTANVAGKDFVNPYVSNTVTDLNGLVSITQVNVPAREAKRTLEYYSDPTGNHTLNKFLYVADIGAEYLQANLHDALTWLCASKLLQIWGQFSGNASYSERAMSQVELSLKNLM